MSETLGLPDPHPLQRLLNEAKWDADGVQNRQREQVVTVLDDQPGALVNSRKKRTCHEVVQSKLNRKHGKTELRKLYNEEKHVERRTRYHALRDFSGEHVIIAKLVKQL